MMGKKVPLNKRQVNRHQQTSSIKKLFAAHVDALVTVIVKWPIQRRWSESSKAPFKGHYGQAVSRVPQHYISEGKEQYHTFVDEGLRKSTKSINSYHLKKQKFCCSMCIHTGQMVSRQN